jgi:hypothetical protein
MMAMMMDPPADPGLPVCSATMLAPQVPTVSMKVMGASACQSPALEETGGAPVLELRPGDALSVPGYVALGPAVELAASGTIGRRGVDVLLPLDWKQIPEAARSELHRLVVLSRFGNAPAHVTAVENITVSSARGGQLRFHLPGHGLVPAAAPGMLGKLGTFQIAMPMSMGQKVKRRFSYRAIGGVSMGGIGSSMNFFRHPELYDAVGVLGADPGPDLTYTQGFIRDVFFGGFCGADSGKLGQLCPTTRKPLLGQGETVGSFEAMPIQTGEGIGLTLGRSLFLRANRDLVRALGNWAYHNPVDAYLPPGVPASTLAQTPAMACAHPVVIKGLKNDPMAKPLYDSRFNPEGKFDVITFCDGGERDGQPGVFDGNKAQNNPAQILLAVDLNANQKRDSGEPVLLQSGEPYRDVGLDGLPDEQEPGYDPVTNPDPAGDNYHYLKNPGGTEGNWRYDAGEPYDDAGLDGVLGKGCPISSGMAGCFDYGEGNGKFDYNPGLQAWLDHDPHAQMEKLAGDVLEQRDIYYDAGIRDFFNAQVSTSSLFGVLSARGLSTQLFGGFPALLGLGPTDESRFDPSAVDISKLGRRVFVRYGNPELSADVVQMTGDGRHAGTVRQVVQRAVVLFSFLLSRWPDADSTIQPSDDPRLVPKGLVFTMQNGRKAPYSLVLPPGYFEPANQKLRYPVVYIGHGYGMDPEDLGKSTGSLIHSFMSDPDPMRRLPKAVLVFVDAKCRPGGEVPQGPLPVDGDVCEEGTFYTDHPAGTYQGESLLQQLDTYLRQTYRLREPEVVEVPL